MTCIGGQLRGRGLAAFLQHPKTSLPPRSSAPLPAATLTRRNGIEGPCLLGVLADENLECAPSALRIFLHAPCHFELASRIDRDRKDQSWLPPALTALAARVCGRVEPRPNMRTGSVPVFRGPKPRGRNGLEDGEAGVSRETYGPL